MFRNQRYSDDRFIPRRAGVNVDTLNYMLLMDTTSSSYESESPTQENKRFSNKAYVKWQRKMLRERIWSNIIIPKKIMNFSKPKQQGSKSYVIHQLWPVYPRNKPLLGSPSTVLDMPSLEGNIYHNCTDWSNSGYLASVFSGEVFLWHPKINSPKSVTDTGGNVTRCVKWSKKREIFAMAMTKKGISIYDCAENKITKEVVCGCQFACTVTALEWTKQNSLIAGCNLGYLTLHHFYMKEGNKLFNAHLGIIIQISLSCNENYLATSGEDNHVRVWLWPSFKAHFEVIYNTPVRGIAWHPWENRYLAIGGGYENGSLSIWNASNYTRLGYKSPSVNDAISIDNLTWNPLTGELVVSYWLRKNGVEKNSIVVLSDLTTEVDAIEYHTGRVIHLLWGNDGATLATAGADESLCMWEFLGNLSNVKKYKNMRRKGTNVNNIFDTARAFGQCIR